MNDEKIIAKIQALLAKTTANGATEAEALSAAAKARELMDKHNVTVSETTIKQSGVTEGVSKSKSKRVDQVICMATGIAVFCDCKALIRDKIHVVFIGSPDDVAMAQSMFDMLRSARDKEWQSFKRRAEFNDAMSEARGNPNAVYRRFSQAFGGRMGQRLKEMTEQRKRKLTATTGTALVVVKSALVDQYMAEKYRRLGVNRSGRLRSNTYTASIAGRAAAERTTIQQRVKN